MAKLKKKKVLRLKSRPWCINKTRKRENEKKRETKLEEREGYVLNIFGYVEGTVHFL